MSAFETSTCTRCGGSGRYSYCQSYGDRCFKCAGSGKQFTKRGAAANAYIRTLRTIKARDVQFGQAIKFDGVPGMSRTTYFRLDEMHTELRSASSLDPVTGETRVHNHLHLSGIGPKGERMGMSVFPDSDVILVPTKAEAAEQIAKALAYQATLTKTGTVAKRATVAA
jgi:hypothetical protein